MPRVHSLAATIFVAAVAAVPALPAAPVPGAHQVTLWDQFLEFLKKVGEELLPIPDALGPLLDVAKDSPTQAVALLEIQAGNHRKKILKEAASTSDRKKQNACDRQMRAINELLVKLEKLKRDRAAHECGQPKPDVEIPPDPEEDGGDPFAGVFTTGTPGLNGELKFALRKFDDPALARTGILTPRWAGNEAFMAPLESVDLTVHLAANPTQTAAKIELKEVTVKIASYPLGPAGATGTNTSTPWKEHTPGAGRFDTKTGEFEFRGELATTNSLYPAAAPSLSFVHLFGYYSPTTGEARAMCDDLTLFPAPKGREIRNRPAAFSVIRLNYDHERKLLHVVDHVTGGGGHTSMIRYADGSYRVRKADDPAAAIDALLSPLRLKQALPNDGFVFESATLRLREGGRSLIEMVLVEPKLDGRRGLFFSEIKLASSRKAESRFVDEFREGKRHWAVLAHGGQAYDLLAATRNLTASGEMPFHSLLYLFAEP